MTIVALDIETLERPIPEELLVEKAKHYREKAENAYKKQETIDAHAKMDLEAWKAKWKFTRGGAQVLCVGMGIVNEHGPMHMPVSSEYLAISEFENETCALFVDFLSAASPHKIVTYNGFGFDLPILMTALARNGYETPLPLGKWDYIDLMKAGFEQYVSESLTLDQRFALYNIKLPVEKYPTPGFANPTGANVAEMWEKDKEDKGSRVANYCLQDVFKIAAIAKIVHSFVRL